MAFFHVPIFERNLLEALPTIAFPGPCEFVYLSQLLLGNLQGVGAAAELSTHSSGTIHQHHQDGRALQLAILLMG